MSKNNTDFVAFMAWALATLAAAGMVAAAADASPSQPRRQRKQRQRAGSEYQNLCKLVKRSTFDSDRDSVMNAYRAPLTAKQLVAVMDLYTFRSNAIGMVRGMRTQVVDIHNLEWQLLKSGVNRWDINMIMD